MDDEKKKDDPQVRAEDNSIAIGGISVGGNVGDIRMGHTTGYTAEQVSVLLTKITSTFQPKPFDGRCPYKGLDVFEEEDAELFFGRERLIEDLVRRTKESRALMIIGPAGSGKSSLVRAGLIHALKQGRISDLHSEHWLYETMKPGRDPLAELARVASSFAGTLSAGKEIRTKGWSDATVLSRICEKALKDSLDRRAVLFVDQFEEIFTQIDKEEERLAFLNLLTHAATVKNGRMILLLAMRSDFVSNCAIYPQLNALLNQQFVLIGAMQPDELVSAIALPAKHVGLPVEHELIARIINDMKGEPGALPLMQFALKDLFDSQQEKGGPIALTLKDYLQHGGIHQSLERHADHAFSSLSASEQGLARSIFSGLIEIGRGTADTARTALFDEIVPSNTKAEDVKIVVQKLADARLVTTDEQAGKDTVMISHGKLIDAWPWLKILVNENRYSIALQNKIANDAQEWRENNRDSSYLYTGTRLENVLAPLGAKEIMLNGLSQEFIATSEAKQQAELEYARRLATVEAQLAELEAQARSKLVKVAQPVKEAAYKKFALIIGNNIYEDDHFAQLQTPEEDVTALVEILKQPLIGGFTEVQALVNHSSSDIEVAIADFCADRGPDDLMLLYFSGHGILDDQGRLYLAATNTRYNRPRGRAISSQFITDNMDSSRCKRQILILDCCHSGAFHRGTKGAVGEKAVTETTFEGKGYGRVVLTATDATQYAWENDQIIGEAINSVFTHFLIDGLKTGAADMDNDGRITVDELYEYVYQQIVGNSLKQTPGRWIYRQEGKFFIANNPYLE